MQHQRQLCLRGWALHWLPVWGLWPQRGLAGRGPVSAGHRGDLSCKVATLWAWNHPLVLSHVCQPSRVTVNHPDRSDTGHLSSAVIVPEPKASGVQTIKSRPSPPFSLLVRRLSELFALPFRALEGRAHWSDLRSWRWSESCGGSSIQKRAWQPPLPRHFRQDLAEKTSGTLR